MLLQIVAFDFVEVCGRIVDRNYFSAAIMKMCQLLPYAVRIIIIFVFSLGEAVAVATETIQIDWLI